MPPLCVSDGIDVLVRMWYRKYNTIKYVWLLNDAAEAAQTESDDKESGGWGMSMRRYRGKRHQRKRFGLWAAVAILVALVIGSVFYIRDFYRADGSALEALESGNGVTVEQTDDLVVFIPEEPIGGLVFYPGGKVEHTAYAPLLRKLAEQGILCVLPEMPFRLAVLDAHAADEIPERYPEIETWFIGGHSLGGSMAAACAEKHRERFEGLVLLAAYSTKDLTDSDLRVLSIYGTEDGVLNRENYSENQSNLPDSVVEVIVDGGNHACFGSYGPQEGDGAARISPQDQMKETVERMIAFFAE